MTIEQLELEGFHALQPIIESTTSPIRLSRQLRDEWLGEAIEEEADMPFEGQ